MDMKVFVIIQVDGGMAIAASTRRLLKELKDVQDSMTTFRCVEVPNEANLRHWTGLLLPESEPYNKGAFKISIQFPIEYPFMPPKITFLTQIYHQNVDEKGKFCLSVIGEDWKPSFKVPQVIQSLLSMLAEPEEEGMMRADLAEEFARDRKQFLKNAEEFTRKHAEKRPEPSQ